MSILLGIDIGTSSCKVAAFDKDGTVLAQATEAYKLYQPDYGWVEQNPEEWWKAICECIQRILNESKISADDISGVGVDGQSWSAIPVDEKGSSLYNTPIWMDTRSSDICSDIVERIGHEEIFKVAGNNFNPSYTTPKILWFKKHLPQIYKNTYKFIQSNSFIVMKLTGVISQDKSQGYGLHCFNMAEGIYDENLADKLEIDLDKLPSIYDCSQIAGTVSEKGSAECGLKKGTPVVAGGLDAACGTLGAGVIHPGETQEQGGQAGGMSIAVDNALSHPKLILSQHVVPGVWLLQGGTVGGGGAVRWLSEILFQDEKNKNDAVNYFEIMTEEAGRVEPGSSGLIFLPYLLGERSPIWDQNAKGTFVGLNYSHKRSHLIRSVFEGVAFSLMHNIKTAEESNAFIKEMNAMGGSANSDVWMQIKSDVSGKPVNIPGSDTATTLGAAILAGVGVGIYNSFDAAVSQTIKIRKTYSPDMENHRKYMKLYEIYLSLYKNLKTEMKNISDFVLENK